uniref:RING-type domain-containing protein n=2 Tax=Steinernema glaseri TaxID=37863 RepID=A0A1I7YC90_9BILA
MTPEACPVCMEIMFFAKVFPCDHLVCASCESLLAVTNAENKKTLVCPMCRGSVVLEGNETLPRLNQMESSMSEMQLDDDSFSCFTCRHPKSRGDCVYCKMCTEAEGRTILVCAMCAIRHHKGHDYEEASFPNRVTKQKALDAENSLKIEADKEIESLKGMFFAEINKSANKKFERLKKTVESMDAKTKRIIEDPNVTTIDLDREIVKLKKLDEKAREEHKAIEEWKELVLAAIRG